MTYTTLVKRGSPHYCDLLPDPTTSRWTYGDVVECDGCGLRYVIVRGCYSPCWTRLRWFHFRAQRRLKRAGK